MKISRECQDCCGPVAGLAGYERGYWRALAGQCWGCQGGGQLHLVTIYCLLKYDTGIFVSNSSERKTLGRVCQFWPLMKSSKKVLLDEYELCGVLKGIRLFNFPELRVTRTSAFKFPRPSPECGERLWSFWLDEEI